jgi:hypothetical protein
MASASEQAAADSGSTPALARSAPAMCAEARVSHRWYPQSTSSHTLHGRAGVCSQRACRASALSISTPKRSALVCSSRALETWWERLGRVEKEQTHTNAHSPIPSLIHTRLPSLRTLDFGRGTAYLRYDMRIGGDREASRKNLWNNTLAHTHTRTNAYRMSEKPAAAIARASASVETTMGPGEPPHCKSAPSTVLCVFTWGRKATPLHACCERLIVISNHSVPRFGNLLHLSRIRLRPRERDDTVRCGGRGGHSRRPKTGCRQETL